MAEPLSIAASIAGLLSLGIQVTQSLVAYYMAYQNQDSHVARTTSRLEALLETFQSLSKALSSRQFVRDEQALIAQVESSIQNCNDLISELQQEVEKVSATPKGGFGTAIKTASRRAAYPLRQSTLQKLDEDVGEIRENLSLALEVLQLNDGQKVQEDLQDIKSVLELVRTSQASREVQDWLKAPDATTNHYEACLKRHTATGLWFVEGSAFNKWLKEDRSFLWLNGFAGCGKSVLTSTAIQYTFRHKRSDPRIGVAFFYFSFNDSSKQDVSGFLRAVLMQLSNQSNDTRNALARLHSSYKTTEPPIPILLDCVRQAIQKFRDVYLIVDALDESPRHGARERVLQTLADFRKWSCPGLHMLVTSRDEIDIREHLAPLSAEDVAMKNSGVNQDIEDFIRGHLERDPAMQKWSAHHSQIEDALIAKAGGVFRWVECQFRSLKSCPRSNDHLKKLLKSLPQSLDETYERMLLQIDSASIEYARRILMWLCFSKRPLTSAELIDAIAVEINGSPCLDKDRRLYDRNDLLQICPGFISVALDPEMSLESKDDAPSYIVSIAHYSVQEYLECDRLRKQEVGCFSLTGTSSNAEIAQACLVYLLDPSLLDAQVTKDICTKLPLLRYAAEYWYQHIEEDGPSSSRIRAFVLQLFNYRNYAFRNWLAIHYPDQPWRAPFEDEEYRIATPTYYLSLLGLHSVLFALLSIPDENTEIAEYEEPILDGNAEVNTQGGEYGNALQAASAGGHEKVVQLLLEKNAQVNIQGGYYGNALQAASAEGHEKIVQLLLEKNAQVNTQGGEYGNILHDNALQAASAGGHEKVVQLLLEKSAQVNTQGGYYGNALQAASAEGHEKIVQLLLEKNAQVNAQGGEYGNALQAASARGHERIVQLLLEKSAQVNIQGGYFGNALQAASAEGHEKIVQLLLEKSAQVNTQGGEYGNALQAASAEGHEKIVRVLLEKNAQVNTQGGEYGNALQAASAEGHEKVVQLLLEKNAQVNTQGGDYGNALQAASAGGHEKVVQLLLEKSAQVNTQGGDYGNALQAASAGGHEKVVQLLLEKSAQVNTQDGYYGNALQAASAEGHEKIVQLLLEKSAQVNTQGGRYGNALQAASAEGHEKIVQLLLEKSAQVNTQGGRYGNALQAASAGGHEKIVRVLLEKNAQVNTQGGEYGNALQAASAEGHERIVQLLLEKNAQVHTQGGLYGDALQAASARGHEKIVQLLQEQIPPVSIMRCDTGAPDGNS